MQPGDEDFAALAAKFPERTSHRQVIVLDVESVQTSCGYGVPVATEMVGRDTLTGWGDHKGREKVVQYQRDNNATSIDGLPTGLAGDANPR